VTEHDASEAAGSTSLSDPMDVLPAGARRQEPRHIVEQPSAPHHQLTDAGDEPPGTPSQESAAQEQPDDGGPAAGGDSAIPPLVKRLATLAGSTTILTALLFYFGWSRAYYFYDYLGVDSSLLSLTTRDYLQLSVDGLFVPILVAGFTGLVLLWAHVRFGPRLSRTRRVHAVSAVICVAGVLLLVNGLSRVLFLTPLNGPLAVAPLSLGAGAVLLFYGMRLQRRIASAGAATSELVSSGEWLSLLALVGLALFWVANDYSAEVGKTRAQQFVAELPSLPNAQLYSAHSLSLSAPGVHETRCRTADATYRSRYDGLKLVLQSGDMYLLVPAKWSRLDGVAILLPRDNNFRLQFSPAGVPFDPRQPC
jgi:hypothetical protein